MRELLSLFAVAAVIEAVWEVLKPAWPRGLVKLEKKKGIPLDRLGTLLLSIIACLAVKFDLLRAAEIPLPIPCLGAILTGILAGRGSNFWHDLLGVIDGIRRDKKPLEIEPEM